MSKDANLTCSLCEQPIKQSTDGVTIAFGWWKSVDPEDPDFDPTGDEYDCCSSCGEKVLAFLQAPPIVRAPFTRRRT